MTMINNNSKNYIDKTLDIIIFRFCQFMENVLENKIITTKCACSAT